MMQKLSLQVLISVFLFTSGCGQIDSTKERLFSQLYADCRMNSTIVFLPLQSESRTDDIIDLEFRNTSEDIIAFDADSWVKIYSFDANKRVWKELNNKMQYSTGREGYFLVGPASDPLSSFSIVDLWPDLSQNDTPRIRVAIRGHIFRDNRVTDECVGAFVDIKS